jgi:hypothetical protein
MSEMTRRDLLLLGGAGLLSAGLTSLLKPGLLPVMGNPVAKCGPAVDMPIYLPGSMGASAGKTFANAPAWARDTPGWYIPNPLSAGSCMLQFQPKALPIKDFSQLPILLNQAKSLGTEAIYLVDWYDGGWTNKGDYIPRTDWGGESALKDGISKVHDQGGRIIFYVEGWIVKEKAEWKKRGSEWSVIQPDGSYPSSYPGYWKMCPAAPGWVEYLAGVAKRLGQYGADGIFIDSQGWHLEIWKCIAKAHGHPLGDPEVFNTGCVNLAKQVRKALQYANPEAIIVTEGPTLESQFEYKDGSLEGGIDTFVNAWLWDAQGNTDSLTTGFSLDAWNQIVAIGAKLCCPGQFLDEPPGASAADFLNGVSVTNDFKALKRKVMWGMYQWRNAGLIMGLPMPSFRDVASKPRDDLKHDLLPRAACIDDAFGSRRPISPAAYLKTLLTARHELAGIIDHGSSVAQVTSGSPQAAAWRFTGTRGVALTAVNVADAPCQIVFQNAPGTWIDAVTGVEFTARGGVLSVSVPAHRVRLLSHDPCQSLRNQIQNLKCDTSQPNAKACEIQARELNLKLEACEKRRQQ